MHILIIEDDLRLAGNIRKLLEHANITSTIAETGEKGLFYVETESYDVVLLDWMLPDNDGVEIVKQIREQENPIPIIMLTAKSQVEDKVESLSSGADDYLTKPFSSDELLARINAVKRRYTGKVFSSVIKIADLSINTANQQVTRANIPILLAPREYALLEYLAFHKGEVVERTVLLHHVWGENIDPFSNTIDVHIRYLRKKIDDPFPDKLIKTIKSKGYILCDD